MSTLSMLGFMVIACSTPLWFMQWRKQNGIIRFMKSNHYLFGWLVLLISTIHIIFSISALSEYPFGILSFLLILALNSMLLVKKKKKKHITIHKYLAYALIVTTLLHIFVE